MPPMIRKGRTMKSTSRYFFTVLSYGTRFSSFAMVSRRIFAQSRRALARKFGSHLKDQRVAVRFESGAQHRRDFIGPVTPTPWPLPLLVALRNSLREVFRLATHKERGAALPNDVLMVGANGIPGGDSSSATS